MNRILKRYVLPALILLAFAAFCFFSPYLGKRYPSYGYSLDFFSGALAYRSLRRRYGNGPRVTPPKNAEFLFYCFLDAQNCDALVGDLEERYKLIHTKFGSRKANFWYWTQAIRSVVPIAWAWGKRVAVKPLIGVVAWAVAKGLIGHDSWLAALVELYRKIRQ